MPSRSQGVIYTYKSQTGQYIYALSVNMEQEKIFMDIGKLLIRLYKDSNLQEPILDDKGRPIRVLKQKDKLKFIGFND